MLRGVAKRRLEAAWTTDDWRENLPAAQYTRNIAAHGVSNSRALQDYVFAALRRGEHRALRPLLVDASGRPTALARALARCAPASVEEWLDREATARGVAPGDPEKERQRRHRLWQEVERLCRGDPGCEEQRLRYFLHVATARVRPEEVDACAAYCAARTPASPREVAALVDRWLRDRRREERHG
jgi:hypothetical protein